jgi:hypothetical protein
MLSLFDKSWRRVPSRAIAAGAIALIALFGAGVSQADAATASAGWTITSLARPTNFTEADNQRCEQSGGEAFCDSYMVTVTNSGSQATDGTPVTITDTLPRGVEFKSVLTPAAGASTMETGGVEWRSGEVFPCGAGTELTSGPDAGRWQVSCTYEGKVPAGDVLQVDVQGLVTTSEKEVAALNDAEVDGGGVSPAAKTTDPGVGYAHVNLLNAPSEFGADYFNMSVQGVDGRPDEQAGDHPYAVTSGFDINSVMPKYPTPSLRYEPVQTVKDVVVYLPLGLAGDPLAAARCPVGDVQAFPSLCPASSRVGTFAIDLSGDEQGAPSTLFPAPIFNAVPEHGYPAEFGFNFYGTEIMMYASVVRTPAGYMLRVATPGISNATPGDGKTVMGAFLTFFGDPAEHNGGQTAAAGFFTNPTRCGAESLKARIEVDSWRAPGDWRSSETTVYPQIAGCNLLQFNPTIDAKPYETTQTDTPSGYEVDLKVPQSANPWPTLATPDLRNTTVALPAGVALSPSAANGLVGCKAEGPEGINVGSSDIGPGGQDLGDPEATELGAGHAGGNGSPYDDGLYHIAPGHCPLKSQIGEVEIETPLLPKPLKGHVYVAKPQCGGEGQEPCKPEDATNGKLYGLYLEASGSGVIVKLKGKVSADPATGQLTTTFTENPQLPFEELKLKLDGGQQAPLANPQTCGTATTTTLLEPWGGPTATRSAEFPVTGCVNPMPFGPGFSAGTVQTLGGAFTPFTMTLTRKDGEQDLAGVSLTMPPGLAGLVSKVPLCPEPQASLGTCPAASRIGTVNAAAGAGSEPLWLSGPVYLTGPYKNAPFGLSVVVPAVAGPFNLGNVIERAAINLDPHTAQVTVTSDPFPQIRDGVPLRLKEVNVTVDRPEFMFNPTNCSQLHITGTVSGDMPDGSAGATAPVSTPFAVAGCKNLPFKPSFSALTHANPSRNGGAYLDVLVKSGAGQANIASVKVNLPKVLPSRLSTLKLACTEAQFAADPAGCPAGSKVGSATAYTPVLPVALTGPAYFVSHGGAKFPELVLVLQGDGVTMDLAGETFISSKGITSSTFRSVPDVPITRFDLVLPTGAHSALAGNGSFCAGAMYMPTQIKGQNGAVVKQNTKIAVTGCKPALRVVGHSVKGSHASIRVTVPSAGTLVATGGSIKRSVKRVAKAGTVTIGVTLSSHALRVLAKNPHQRVNAEVKLRFNPKHGAPLTAYVRLLMG